MDSDGRHVVLFTGQSGIRIRDCLHRLFRGRHDFSTEPGVFSVEKRMERISLKSFLEILSAPPRVQEALWSEAFRDIVKEIPTRPQLGQHVFLNFHATYYHQRKTEFLSPVDFGQLLALRDRIRMVIVLIDDCYDIYRRLMAPGEMYGSVREEGKPPDEALIVSIINLTSVLEWREIEIAFSRKIAQLLEVPLHVLAVKHPSRILSRLITSSGERRVYYLSHPISSVRADDDTRITHFFSELGTAIQELLASDQLILYIPDTIDENRIKVDRNTQRLVPELRPGWPLPFRDEWLFAPLPAEVRGLNPLNPQDFDFYRASSDLQSAVSWLLQILLKKIVRQINSRDRTLVEQSKDGVVVYRPYWAGVTPQGVDEELSYNDDLRTRYGEVNRLSAILSAEVDWAKWRITFFFTLACNNLALDPACAKRLENLTRDWLNDPDKLSAFQDRQSLSRAWTSVRASLELHLPKDYAFRPNAMSVPSSSLAAADMLAQDERRERCWRAILDQIPQEDPFRRYTSTPQDKYLTCQTAHLHEDMTLLTHDLAHRRFT